MGTDMIGGTESDGTYLSEEQLVYFRKLLLARREELVAGSKEMLAELRETELRKPDLIDLGSLHAEKDRRLKTRSRQHLLIGKIDHALRRIQDGTYGYCELTGEEIGLRRLMVMPLTTLSIEAQTQMEREDAMCGRRLQGDWAPAASSQESTFS